MVGVIDHEKIMYREVIRVWVMKRIVKGFN